jgi:hypothetical protein
MSIAHAPASNMTVRQLAAIIIAAGVEAGNPNTEDCLSETDIAIRAINIADELLSKIELGY